MEQTFNLARWLLGTGTDAEDVTQDPHSSAFRESALSLRKCPGLVACRLCATPASLLRPNRMAAELNMEFDETTIAARKAKSRNLALAGSDREQLTALWNRFRESFRRKSHHARARGLLLQGKIRRNHLAGGCPIGTVMSALARARDQLRKFSVSACVKGGPPMPCDQTQTNARVCSRRLDALSGRQLRNDI